jgi:hypothetical protein
MQHPLPTGSLFKTIALCLIANVRKLYHKGTINSNDNI